MFAGALDVLLRAPVMVNVVVAVWLVGPLEAATGRTVGESIMRTRVETRRPRER